MSSDGTVAHAQGRALAISHASCTLLTPTILLVLALHDPAFARNKSCFAPYFVLYTFFTAATSVVGMVGAIRLKSSLISAYTCMHAAALLYGTLTLINVFVPFDLRDLFPILPDVKFNVREFCQENDDGYGSDKDWSNQCRKGLTMVKFGAASMGLILMAAQWWALRRIWGWSDTVRTSERGRQLKKRDMEKAKHPE